MTTQSSILLVEDSPVDACVFQLKLKALGEFRLHHVMDAESALQHLGQAEVPVPRAIFVDIGLPKQNGLQLLEHIKADRRLAGVPTYVVTGNASPAVQAVSSIRGASGALQKPVNATALALALVK
jgi:CheY-like chemotaxis protein